MGENILLNETGRNKSKGFSTKARALLAGGLVLGVGATFVLAAWTDNEWVFGSTGGADGPGNPGTGIYQMQQNTFTGAAGAELWSDQPTANGGALTFSVGAKDLKPGTTVYAPMQLRTVVGSKALNAVLAEGVQAANPSDDNSTELYKALTYHAKTGVSKAACNSAGMTAGGAELIPAGSKLDFTTGAPAISLAAASSSLPGTAVDICFALSLPSTLTEATTIQGKKTIPLWRFTSIAS